MRTVAILFVLAPFTLWAAAALYFDFPFRALRIPAALLYVLLIAGIFVLVPPLQVRVIAGFLLFLAVLVWWRSIKPSNDRVWQADVARTAWAEIDGDDVTIHNFRQCEYRSEYDYTCSWSDKRFKLSDIRGIDLFVVYWGSDWIAHPITSFQIGEHDHVALSIDLRKEQGERYSTIRSFFRTYELFYTVAPETDVVRLRTTFRKGPRKQGEDVYLYRTTAGPEWSRLLFRAYAYRINELQRRPEWYNAAVSNCTTNIFDERNSADDFAKLGAAPLAKLLNRFDWRILLNGKGDKMEYQRGDLESAGLSFAELKRQAYITPTARANQDPTHFSAQIRQGRVGF